MGNPEVKIIRIEMMRKSGTSKASKKIDTSMSNMRFSREKKYGEISTANMPTL